MKKLRIGIVGCGAIGSSLAKLITSELSGGAIVQALYDIDAAKVSGLAYKLHRPGIISKSLDDLIRRSDLVIEATGAAFSFEIASKAIDARRDVLVMSVGGLVEGFPKLKALAKRKGANIFIPSGAICGIDALKALRASRISKVLLTTRKPPRSFKGVKYISDKRINLDKLSKDKLIFSGSALQAIKNFPQNINVAATLSLAGIGPEKTRVCIIASPRLTKNIHEVEIVSDAGRVIARSENLPHPENPKTSYLAVISALAVIRQILEPVKIGN